ncbi:MAG: ATP-grasp domain-containing protein [Vitreoscilla sp.]|nr:ATP-grasp domain-containing protein [Vitreoscilla sp.]
MARIAVAALSARALAEAAQRDGHEVLALDLFGDRDTRAAASLGWAGVGDGKALRMDAERLLAALRSAARQGVQGWVYGSGFDGLPDLLAAGAAVLPLWGATPTSVAAVRDPQRFFAALQGYGIAHPAVRYRRPEWPEGWLRKDAHACGGWHVRPAQVDDTDPPAPGQYWQCEVPGQPMSVTLLANGQRAQVLGVNTQQTRSWHGRPHVFVGVAGPVALPGRTGTALQGIANCLANHFGLRGLCGVDFLLQGEDILVLELNPRPPASVSMYGQAGGLFDAHLAACQHGHLPLGDAAQALSGGGQAHAQRYVLARRTLPLNAQRLALLATWPGVHDVPNAAVNLNAGDPVCTLGAKGAEAQALSEHLQHASQELLNALESTP